MMLSVLEEKISFLTFDTEIIRFTYHNSIYVYASIKILDRLLKIMNFYGIYALCDL